MRYKNFGIDIRSTGPGELKATVVDAPFQDRPEVLFPPPLDPPTLDRLLTVAEEQARARRDEEPEGKSDRGQPAASSKPSPQDVGKTLYQAVFKDELGELFTTCRRSLPQEKQVGLRLRLTFRLDDEEADYLAALPWELLWDPKDSDFLARDIRTPVVRQLLNPHPTTTLDVAGPLRILVIDAAPATMTKLDLKLETQRMQEALQTLIDAGEAKLLRLPNVSLEALRDALRDDEIHVLHIMGHGGYHEGSGMGAIFFAAPDGKKDQVDGEMLGALLKGIPELRLVVLNACGTARHAGRAGAPLFYGVASGIIDRTGIPAVVANQHVISDKAAIAFSDVFYRRLAARDPIETAMSEARLLLSMRTSEWATPVLFLAAEEGNIFGTEGRAGRTVAVTPNASRVEKAPLHVGLVSFIGSGKDSDQGMWGREMKERCDAVQDFTESFDPDSPNGRFIREQRLWQEKVFPDLREALLDFGDQQRLHLDLAAHQSIAFAAGWLLEAKSGLKVRVKQRTQGNPLDWHPEDGSAPQGQLWLDREDIELSSAGPDVAMALSVSNPEVAPEVRDYVEREGLAVGRIIDAVVAPQPGQRSVKGGEHSLRLAQALVHRVRQRRPHERGGRLHLFGSAPNALLFYLGQLSRSFGRVVLYEYAFNVADGYSRYQRSIELPPPDEAAGLPPGW